MASSIINGDELFAFDAKTGAPLWSSSVVDGTSSPAVVGGVVYASGRVLAALNAGPGAALWSASLGGPLVTPGGSPAVAKGTVYIGAFVAGQHGSSSGILYAVNAHSGKTIWSAPVPSAITSSPAVANGVVYVGSFGHPLCVRREDRCAAGFGRRGCRKSSPTVANGMVFSESVSEGKIFALGVGGAGAAGRGAAP